MTRGLLLAVQFLTRLPVPRSTRAPCADELSRSALWFPLVGLLVGTLVAALLALGAYVDPWLGAWLGLLAWIWVTGSLHLDGLADLADALGAAHRDATRFLPVLRDPHVGTFGVVALLVATISKLVLLSVALRHAVNLWLALPLLAAWARFGAVVWSAWLPALAAGTAERFTWRASKAMIGIWAVALLGASVLVAPSLALAPAALWAWGFYLQRRLGGMSGDCLGAGIEIVEIVLLTLVVVSAKAPLLSGWV